MLIFRDQFSFARKKFPNFTDVSKQILMKIPHFQDMQIIKANKISITTVRDYITKVDTEKYSVL